jgi:hypothetical protein
MVGVAPDSTAPHRFCVSVCVVRMGLRIFRPSPSEWTRPAQHCADQDAGEWAESRETETRPPGGGAGTHFCFIYGRMAAGCKYTFSDVSIWTNGCAQRARRPHISLIL